MPETAFDKLYESVVSLMTLEIATLVVDGGFMTVDKDKKLSVSFATAGQPSAQQAAPGAYTSINMVSGDIVNAVSREFAPVGTGSDPGVVAFHQTQAKASQEIIAANVKVLMELAQVVGKNLGEVLKKA
ncbi:hypothetical protein [Caenispirillum bisanense]|uniref:Uncharacterized protein n=1 Tax=Caenispirillum bisanense TaxID=414052 RepID=A0A286G6P7_9PROT|nr:hypothetical protein [Caenispirillum bisanense]SOD91227.1 hypothetical protein SAMN05421508_101866 [Caenispirillum bisanense]